MKWPHILAGIIAACVNAFSEAQSSERKDLYRAGENFVSFLDLGEDQGIVCAVRLSNGPERGAISFHLIRPSIMPIKLELIYGHELGTGATHGARKGDAFEVRVDGELLANGKLEAGVAPYEGHVDQWQGALLDALAYGKFLTWGFPGQTPLITVIIPDNEAMTRALVECQSLNGSSN